MLKFVYSSSDIFQVFETLSLQLQQSYCSPIWDHLLLQRATDGQRNLLVVLEGDTISGKSSVIQTTTITDEDTSHSAHSQSPMCNRIVMMSIVTTPILSCNAPHTSLVCTKIVEVFKMSTPILSCNAHPKSLVCNRIVEILIVTTRILRRNASFKFLLYTKIVYISTILTPMQSIDKTKTPMICCRDLLVSIRVMQGLQHKCHMAMIDSHTLIEVVRIPPPAMQNKRWCTFPPLMASANMRNSPRGTCRAILSHLGFRSECLSSPRTRNTSSVTHYST
jgi:hypothetical protein